jgi:chromosome segregation ATPase
VRHQLEVSIKEYTLRIEQIESSKDGKKGLAKLQTRINELEQEVDVITRRERDVTAENAKLKRQLQELRSQSESDHRLIIEYTETINILETKYITIKRQFEQSEEVLNITMAKYRKTQALLEEAERRADRAENNVTIVRRQSVNVTRGAGGSVTTRAVSMSRDSRHIRS